MVAKPGRRTSRRQSAGRTGAAEHEHEARQDRSPARGRSNERAPRRRASSSVERDRNVVLAVREKHDERGDSVEVASSGATIPGLRPESLKDAPRLLSVRRIWLVLGSVVVLAIAVVYGQHMASDESLRQLRTLLDDRFGDLSLEFPNLQRVLPQGLEYMDGVLDQSRRWFETLDFAVGRDYASRGYKPHYPVIMLPGVISTGLEAWTTSKEESGSFRDRVWGSSSMIRKLFLDKEKWLRHMSLDPVTGLDPEGIRVRAAEGLDAASYFAAGYWIWNKVIQNLAAVGYDMNMLTLAAYDWRLSFPNLERRDRFFSRLRNTFELNLQLHGKKSVLLAHSMGGNVAFYFLKWVEHEAGEGWVDKHVEGTTLIAGSMLGVPKAMSALSAGDTREIVDMPAPVGRLFEHFFSPEERVALFRSLAGASSMLIKGGNAVWGNDTWAPDDPPNATVSYGRFFDYPSVYDNSTHTVVQGEPGRPLRIEASDMEDWLLQHTDENYRNMVTSTYSNGIERDPRQIRRNDRDPTKWSNPLEVALPNAPNMNIYCLYGWGKPTERAYVMRDTTANYQTDQVGSNSSAASQKNSRLGHRHSRIDTSASDEDGVPKVHLGCRFGEGDGTVPLLSLGTMCAEGWHQKRYNPGGAKLKVHEVLHRPDALDLRGGPQTGDHVDILGAYEVNEAIVQIATGHGHEVKEQFHSNIREYAKRIQW